MKFKNLDNGQVFRFKQMKFVKIEKVDGTGMFKANAIQMGGDLTNFDDDEVEEFSSLDEYIHLN